MRVVVNVALEKERAFAMKKLGDGYFTSMLPGACQGDTYYFYVDEQGPYPDPASRYQPSGVHGPSAIIDPASYEWRDSEWIGIDHPDLIFYELHVGTFTTEGSFRSAADRLSYLKELGITAVELMPLADFPGDRNWGYDGVALFAPARCYGTPDDLRYFVDRAHQLGLAVFVDAVYNHFGPDGAYQGSYSRHYFTKHHHTPWGDAINFDGALSQPVREYFIENTLRWIYEYHLDGLRLDATHAIKDDSPRHFLTELTAIVSHHSAELGRRVHIIAEDARNMAALLKPESRGGMGLSAVWADDFHHHTRRALAGDSDGYFAEAEGTVPSMARAAKRGWIRGSDPTGLNYQQFVFCIQNHDQIGNRAMGDRLHSAVDLATYRAASTLLLLLPETPLLFMGQEWAASTPFRYFTSHGAELGKLVTEGRRREFADFSLFLHTSIPDPQSFETFALSRLKWEELTEERHAGMLRLYKSLIHLRRLEAAADVTAASPDLHIEALDESTLLLKRTSLLAIIRLLGHGEINLTETSVLQEPVLDSENPQFAADSRPIKVDRFQSRITFDRPGAIVFQTTRESLT
jgi:maltooligosyltrehalose trehalohydrolase